MEGRPDCGRCAGPAHDLAGLDPRTYAYLLAVYLGDGCLGSQPKDVYALRVVLDTVYPGIIAETATAIESVRGRPPRVAPEWRGQNCVEIVSYWKAWPCLLPQHGPGRKHERPIELAGWQQEHVRAAPEYFLRGLIHTDGWRGSNRVVSKGKAYEYPRYQFSNRSDDIRGLFCAACDQLAIPWRPWGRWHISVARREAVARLDGFIGPKE